MNMCYATVSCNDQNKYANPPADTWACLWEKMRLHCGGMGERLTHSVALNVPFSSFLGFDAVTVTTACGPFKTILCACI